MEVVRCLGEARTPATPGELHVTVALILGQSVTGQAWCDRCLVEHCYTE